ncbi:MAG: serine/threonine-protein kinase [Planctomycetaceae bacterium]
MRSRSENVRTGDEDGPEAVLARKLLEQRLERLWKTSVVPDASSSPQDFADSRFRLRRVLGSGSFGVVYLADDLQLDRQVALKLPRPEVLLDDEKRRRFLREAAHAALLEHPGIVRIYDAGSAGSTPYIAAEYCNGPNLGEWLAAQDQLPPWQASVGLIAQVAEAVAFAHSRGIYHRDLKPANIMLSSKNASATSLSDFVPLLTDFGLAKLSDPALTDTRSSLLVGTPLYMAPEQLEPGGHSENTPAADVYSLGVILFEMLTGQPPLQGQTYLEVLDRIRFESPARLRAVAKHLPSSLERVCETCFRKNPSARYSSVDALAADLRRCVAGEPVTGKRHTWLSRFAFWCRRPQRVVNAGWFAIWSQTLLAFWTVVALVIMAAYDVATWQEYAKFWPDALTVLTLIHLPMGIAGWITLRGRTWGPWLGLLLTISNIPPVVWAIATEPMLFRDLYVDENPFFYINTHSMILVCLVIQAFLFACAIAAAADARLSSDRNHRQMEA